MTRAATGPRLAIDALWVAPGAREALAYCRADGGRVAGRYRRVLILETGPRWIAVHGTAVARSPFSVVLASDARVWPGDQTPVSTAPSELAIGGLTVRLPAENVPSASPVAPARTASDWRWALPILAPFVAESAFGVEPRAGLRGVLRERGEAALAALTRAVSADELQAAADRLCGLGVGATPSGDDALVGFLGAWLRLAPHAQRAPAHRLAAELAEAAPRHTSRLAAEFYYHLAQERLSEPIECVLAALAAGDPAALHHAVGRLAEYGASSGRDALAGIAAYLRGPRRT
jgi:Protein of unknown function (DUF2877)